MEMWNTHCHPKIDTYSNQIGSQNRMHSYIYEKKKELKNKKDKYEVRELVKSNWFTNPVKILWKFTLKYFNILCNKYMGSTIHNVSFR